jgi:stearoyl-CoA desaturase (delta-9 desaturase)
VKAESGRLSLFWLGVFGLLHALCAAALWTGVTRRALVLCAVVYLFQMLAITAGYHRYFSHRAFKTSRLMQFVLALCAQSSMQKGVLWWAGHHRYHHQHSDQDDDIHSPKDGIWQSYAGWIFYDTMDATRLDRVGDLARYPELCWLNRYHFVPTVLLAIVCFATAGWSGLVVGYLWPTILTHHATFANNCFAHVFGTRRYDTGDLSRNNWVLAAILLGEGWHNNHHRYAGSARHGFQPWEVDVTYYVLLLLARLGLVWDLRTPPPEVLMERTPQVGALEG